MLISAALLIAVAYLAICLLLFFGQRSLIYFPQPRRAEVPVMSLERDGVRLLVSTRRAPGATVAGGSRDGLPGATGADDGGRAVLYFGGNAEDVSVTVGELARDFPAHDIFAMHYRGYGGSGGAPAEPDLVADAIALQRQIAATHLDITVIGRSLGSAIAIRVAAAEGARRLVLITPFDTLLGLAGARFPWVPVGLLLRDRYESSRVAGGLAMPTTIIIAAADEIVPVASSQRLAGAFPSGQLKVVILAGAGHNTVSEAPGFREALVGATPGGP